MLGRGLPLLAPPLPPPSLPSPTEPVGAQAAGAAPAAVGPREPHAERGARGRAGWVGAQVRKALATRCAG